MSPETFAARCSEITATMRGHEAHRALDLLTNEALRSLGYGEGIAVFETAVGHWHAEADPYPYVGPCPNCEADGNRTTFAGCDSTCCRGEQRGDGECRFAAPRHPGFAPSPNLRWVSAIRWVSTFAGARLRDPLLFFALGLGCQFAFLTWIGGF